MATTRKTTRKATIPKVKYTATAKALNKKIEELKVLANSFSKKMPEYKSLFYTLVQDLGAFQFRAGSNGLSKATGLDFSSNEKYKF